MRNNNVFDDDDRIGDGFNDPLGHEPFGGHDPFDPQPTDIPNITRNDRSWNENNLNYECPACGGRFAHWDHSFRRTDSEGQCPFCFTEKGEYESEDVLLERIEELQARVEELESEDEEEEERVNWGIGYDGERNS